MDLDETGEFIGDAEIFVEVHFYDEKKQYIQMHTVFLPWAIEKGFNGNTKQLPFFTWPEKAYSAVATILEDDSDTSASEIANNAINILRFLGSTGEALANLGVRVIDKVQKTISKADYIGTGVFLRYSPKPFIKTAEKNAIFYVKEER